VTDTVLKNNNVILQIIAQVADRSDVMSMPQLPAILKAMADHDEWVYIKEDEELNQLIAEAETTRLNYTAVTDLRWAYEKVLLRYVHLLCNQRGLLLIYRWDDRNSLLFGMTIEQGRTGLKEIYALRTVKNREEILKYEYHEDLTRNVFDAIKVRIRHVDAGISCFGWPEAHFITFPQE
jgi:hypothetical protein